MEAVTTAWESIDWDRLQTRVETEVDALGRRQDDSENRRKRLVEESNAYRDRTDKEVRKLAVPLIKAFQSEFDGLIARSTAAETALIEICSSIVNLPDPKSLLKGAEAWKSDAEKTRKAVEEREELRRQLLKANSEIDEWRAKDVKVRKLKDKLAKLESEQDELIETAVSEVEKRAEHELSSRVAELVDETERMRETNEQLEKQLDAIDSKNKEMQRKLDLAKASVEQKEGLENEQLSIALKDLADAKHQIVFLEEKITRLESEAEKVAESKKAGNIEDIAALGSVLVQKDEQISQLTEDLRAADTNHQREAAEWKAAVTAVERKNRDLIAEIGGLKTQLESQMDYEAIRNELRLLREIEFGAAAEANSESIERLGETVETLDRLLAEKNRRLQNDNASLRVLSDGYKGDEVMTAIVTGSHTQHLVNTIGKRVGIEEALAYRQKNTDMELIAKIHAARKKREERNEFRFDDPNVDVLTYLKKVKEKKERKERAAAAASMAGSSGVSSGGAGAGVTGSSSKHHQHVTKLDTHTITTTALPPILQSSHQHQHHRPSSGTIASNSSASSSNSTLSSVLKEEMFLDEDLKLSTVLNLKGRFTSPTKLAEPKTSEEQQAERETIEKMQSRIRANVEALNGRPLNTTEIASHCKRLMIAYNIGQRLFAKHVMNQVVKSQGSLSELLSKPRHWNKLTDKGREAFRRIYGWISDNEAIDLLCSLAPRRVWPAEQNVEHPNPETLIGTIDPQPPAGGDQSPRKEEPALKKIKLEEPEPILVVEPETPDEKILLMAAATTTTTSASAPIPAAVEPPIPPISMDINPHGTTACRASRWRHDDISKEKILSIFQSELAKLKEQETTIVEKPTAKTTAAHARRFSNPPTGVSFETSSLSGKIRPAAVEAVLKQRMATGLKPLTQPQYDTYTCLDTDLLVKQIKEFLTVNSISQRQFGEFILGLSQGSVSDLLARPKSWAQLTQKGREPFIRMQQFMDDVEAANSRDDHAEKQPEITVCEEGSDLAKTLASLLSNVQSEPPPSVIDDDETMATATTTPTSSSVQIKMESPETLDLVEKIDSEDFKLEPVSEIDLIMLKEGSSLADSSASMNGKLGDPSKCGQSGDESFDSFEVVLRVRDLLAEHGISAKVFGEEYLDCTPALLADVLMRTKPFKEAKPAEKEMYILMNRFLSDPSAIPMLCQKEATKDPSTRFDGLFKALSNPRGGGVAGVKRKGSSDGEDYEPNAKKPIQRTVITDYQKDVLRFVFINELHPPNELCDQIAQKLDMSVRTVQNWFHNHRTRSKAREREGKVYSDALPNGNLLLKKSVTWRDELQTMLDNAPSVAAGAMVELTALHPGFITSTRRTSSTDSLPINNNTSSSPTLTPPAPLFVFDKPAAPMTSSTTTTTTKKASVGSGQLDKLVARMRQIAEVREAAAANSN